MALSELQTIEFCFYLRCVLTSFLNWGCNYGVTSVHAEGVMRNTLCLHKWNEMKPIISENSAIACNRPSVSLFVHCPHLPQCKYHWVLFVCLQPQVQLKSCLPRVMFPCCRFALALHSYQPSPLFHRCVASVHTQLIKHKHEVPTTNIRTPAAGQFHRMTPVGLFVLIHCKLTWSTSP